MIKIDKKSMEIGLRIRSTRMYRNYSIKELADYLNVSEATVSRYENGVVARIKEPILESIAHFLNVTVSYLKGETDNIGVLNEDYNVSKHTLSIPLLGTIAAGVPILAEQNIEEYFNIDSSIKADFALRIKGESMINVGIHDKDIVFIKKQSTLENGQIGAILIGEEATLKRFFKADGHYILQPENNELSPILVKDEVQILGKYVACLHIESNS